MALLKRYEWWNVENSSNHNFLELLNDENFIIPEQLFAARGTNKIILPPFLINCILLTHPISTLTRYPLIRSHYASRRAPPPYIHTTCRSRVLGIAIFEIASRARNMREGEAEELEVAHARVRPIWISKLRPCTEVAIEITIVYTARYVDGVPIHSSINRHARDRQRAWDPARVLVAGLFR